MNVKREGVVKVTGSNEYDDVHIADIVTKYRGNDNNDDDEEIKELNKRYFRFSLASNVFFLIASILYLWLSIIEYEWAITTQNIPESVLRADDDVAWVKSPSITRVEDRRRSLTHIRKVGGSRLLYSKVSNLFSQYNAQQKGRRNMEESEEQAKSSYGGFGTSMFVEFTLDDNALIIDNNNNNNNNNNTIVDEKDLEETTTTLSEQQWNNLPSFSQQIASTLGYNESNWGDNETALEVTNLYWDKLTEEEKNAAFELYGSTEYSQNVRHNDTNTTVSWEDSSWIELPEGIQNALTVLGYNASTWDNAGTPSTLNMYWDDLSLQEQTAAFELYGSNEASWNGWNDAEKTNWDNHGWNGLPDNIQEAATTLNYTQTVWDNGEELNHPWWENLSTEEQSAVLLLGYDEHSWNDFDNVDWDDYDWNQLPQESKKAAKKIGYNKSMWDNDTEPYTKIFNWKELSFSQQESATLLGYTEETWNAREDEPVIVTTTGANSDMEDTYNNTEDTSSVTDTNNTNWGDMAWKDLSDDARAAAKLLGHMKNTWDNSVSAYTDSMYWNELTPEQQEAATLLGYKQETWDNGDASTTTTAIITVDEQSGTNTTTDKTPNYDDFYWDQLPQALQGAAEVLGYDKSMWDSGGAPDTDNLSWSQLTPEQQNAAILMGYDQVKWDYIDGGDVAVVDGDDTSSSIPAGKDDIQSEAMWDSLAWDNFSMEVQKAWEVLGYNKHLWNDGTEAPIEELAWDQLSQEEKDSAIYVGYNQEKWDSADWDDSYWTDLPDDKKRQAIVLGYDENSWDNSLWVYTEDMSWVELTFEQQHAASILGYDQEKWDADINDAVGDVDVSFWDDFSWRDLPLMIKEAYKLLGYNENLWNNDGMPSIELKYWDDLTLDQQKAAAFLGYDQESWDFDDGSVTYWADDDYLFEVPGRDSSVSREMIIYFFAALGFMITGILDFIIESSWYNCVLFLAGFSGVISAILLEEDLDLAIILNCVSVHLFFLEFFVLFWEHFRRTDVLAPRLLHLFFVADILFGVGAIMDVALSYLYLDISSQWNVHIAHSSIAAAVAWLLCALLYIIVTIMEHMKYEGADTPTIDLEEQCEPTNNKSQPEKVVLQLH